MRSEMNSYIFSHAHVFQARLYHIYLHPCTRRSH